MFERDRHAYRRLGWATAFGGFATFMAVHSTQALLPALAAHFHTSSAQASLALSATVIGVAVAMIPLAWLAEQRGRVRMITLALTVGGALGFVAAVAPNLQALVAVRGAQGIVLAAVPALLMSHIGHEVAPDARGGAMGRLIAGNTLGGLTGRLLAGAVADHADWRLALASVAVVSMLCTLAFRLLVPPSATAAGPSRSLADLYIGIRVLARDRVVFCLCGLALLLLGSFETVYNYLGFRLLGAPFTLSPGQAGLIFLAYIAGAGASVVAGRSGDRIGRRWIVAVGLVIAMAGIWITLVQQLWTVLLGLVLVTVGFFAAHSAASGWIADHVAGGHVALTSALYQVAYYTGGGLGGFGGGLAFDAEGWPGAVGFVTALLAGCLALYLIALRDQTPAVTPKIRR
ncbi:MFS transporter [Tsukamurella sp. 8F]|uniref:MFS transporter n=1 Tax=unclassified Tsukamurella TaxID=2633480 RepID=UPI0023B8E378|nr:MULTISPECIES: MFS transporter [unclassified Tsukamurella]MDF0531908.1 MFS transporter [Tsukamurella sp. 8J]MDF0586952.1 MFS transporter [Tsukamurella sp. 8F]